MKTTYEKDWDKTYLHIDLEETFNENYQLQMIRKNKIPGILKMKGLGLNNGSRYTFTVNGMQSMRQTYEKTTIKKEDIWQFISSLITVTNTLKNYLLTPDCLLLSPDYVFIENGIYLFCYLPIKQKILSESFHEMTEYFVKNLDYEETEGIFLAYELHKATLQENYNLEQILKNYEEKEIDRRNEMEELKEGRARFTEEYIFTTEEESSEIYEPVQDMEPVCEMGGWKKPWKKVTEKIKKKRWGSWDDLILETDGQDKRSQL